MGAHTIRIKCSIVQFLFFMAPSLYCSHSSAGNTMKSQFSLMGYGINKKFLCKLKRVSFFSEKNPPKWPAWLLSWKEILEYYDLESIVHHIHVGSMKIHGNGVNICVFFVHFTDHQSVIYVPCPRSGHPTRVSNFPQK